MEWRKIGLLELQAASYQAILWPRTLSFLISHISDCKDLLPPSCSQLFYAYVRTHFSSFCLSRNPGWQKWMHEFQVQANEWFHMIFLWPSFQPRPSHRIHKVGNEFGRSHWTKAIIEWVILKKKVYFVLVGPIFFGRLWFFSFFFSFLSLPCHWRLAGWLTVFRSINLRKNYFARKCSWIRTYVCASGTILN